MHEVPNNVSITPANTQEAEHIVNLLTPNITKLSILPRSIDDIRANIDNFRVARLDDKLVGCIALKDYGEGLYEIRSLAVSEEVAGQGIGSKLVQTIMDLARTKHAQEIFTLTVRPHIFIRLGFINVPKERFKQKIWSDCRACKKREQCDETSLTFIY